MSVAIQVVPAKRPGRKPKRATEPVVVVESDEEIEDDEDEDESENIQVKMPVCPPVRSTNEKYFVRSLVIAQKQRHMMGELWCVEV